MNRSRVQPNTQASLLTPREAADELLQAARLQSFQTNGIEGLEPIKLDGRPMYRARDIAGFLALRGNAPHRGA